MKQFKLIEILAKSSGKLFTIKDLSYDTFSVLDEELHGELFRTLFYEVEQIVKEKMRDESI